MAGKNELSNDFNKRVSDALSKESDRACVILTASWIDHFLKIKLSREFSKGNSKARNNLFSSNSPFATFSAKLNAVYCAGWIDDDVFHDLQLIRKLRNEFAHSIDAHTLNEKPFSDIVAKFRTPKRQYHNWGTMNVAAIDNGVIFFTDECPAEAKDDLEIGKLIFRMGAAVIIGVLVANLKIPVRADEAGESFLVELPDYMKEIFD